MLDSFHFLLLLIVQFVFLLIYIIMITILLSTMQILITVLHYGDDTMGSNKIMTTP